MLCFILGWPLEWVPIVVIIVPIFLPLLTALNDAVHVCPEAWLSVASRDG